MLRIMRTAAVMLLVAAPAVTAGPICGTLQSDPQELGPRKFVSLSMTCSGQEETVVTVDVLRGARDPIGADDPSEFDRKDEVQLQVFDASGKEIAADYGDHPSVSFTPQRTGKFHIKVNNLSHDRPVVCRITAE